MWVSKVRLKKREWVSGEAALWVIPHSSFSHLQYLQLTKKKAEDSRAAKNSSFRPRSLRNTFTDLLIPHLKWPLKCEEKSEWYFLCLDLEQLWIQWQQGDTHKKYSNLSERCWNGQKKFCSKVLNRVSAVTAT